MNEHNLQRYIADYIRNNLRVYVEKKEEGKLVVGLTLEGTYMSSQEVQLDEL